MATHYVLKRGRYWEEWESYRDARRRPRKRFIKYWGQRDPRDWPSVPRPQVDDRFDWDKALREEEVRLNQENDAYEMFRELQSIIFKEETGLDLPANPLGAPVPVDKEPAFAEAAVAAPDAVSGGESAESGSTEPSIDTSTVA